MHFGISSVMLSNECELFSVMLCNVNVMLFSDM